MRGANVVATNEAELAALATALVDSSPPSGPALRAEHCSGRGRTSLPDRLFQPDTRGVAGAIVDGGDPLGDALCAMRSATDRRRQGMVYTPPAIVDAMVLWAATQPKPVRVVDAGAGSGRFLFAAARQFPDAHLVAAECDPLAALALRANASVLGVAQRLSLHAGDYRDLELPTIGGPTLFLGNPPYVRHHDIPPAWKNWLAETASCWGIKASRLAGLHVHFLFQTCRLARAGDYGALITAAEWLDVNYGAAMRTAFLDVLGGVSVDVLAPTSLPFADAAATGAVVCFRTGRPSPAVRFRAVASLGALGRLRGGRSVPRAVLRRAGRWSPFLRQPGASPPCGHLPLGELCRVHRGQVTGCNAVWVAGRYAGALPAAYLVPAVTRAKELFDAGDQLSDPDVLRRVIDLPVDLEELDVESRRQVAEFLEWAKSMAADASYVASRRRAWWAVQMREPAPILCTYMARRSPAFVTNPNGARHVNVAHGLYPREPLPAKTLDALAAWLRRNVRTSSGRTYAGGLTKFEPREVERIPIPPLDQLHARTPDLDRG